MKDDLPRLTIGQAAEETGVSARTIRYYEELGLLSGVRRSEGGRRVYGADEVERLRFISRLKKLGLSLAEIKELNAIYAIAGSTDAMLERLEELLARRLDDLDGRIAELMMLRDDMSKYRDHVEARIGTVRRHARRTAPQTGAASDAPPAPIGRAARGEEA